MKIAILNATLFEKKYDIDIHFLPLCF